MPSSISACAAGTMFEREASRIVPGCEARSERPPLFRRPSLPVPSLPLTLRERAAPLRTRRLTVARSSRRRTGDTQTPQTGPATALGRVPARVMAPTAKKAANLRISA
jgi:hypothetical protein